MREREPICTIFSSSQDDLLESLGDSKTEEEICMGSTPPPKQGAMRGNIHRRKICFSYITEDVWEGSIIWKSLNIPLA